MPKWVQPVIGAAEIAAGAALVIFTQGAGAAVGKFLISAGIGTTIGGVGNMLQKGPLRGVFGQVADPVASRNVVYGQAHIAPVEIYRAEFGDNNKYLDLVFALASHPCQSVDQMLVDGNYVPVDPVTRCSYSRDFGKPNPYYYSTGSHDSDADHHGRGHTTSTSFTRQSGVVTVTITNSAGLDIGSFMLMGTGDRVKVDSMPTGSGGVLLTLQGTFAVTVTGTNTFTYICPGPDLGPINNAGHITPVFADYKSKIYMEVLDGSQTLGQTFNAITTGTPYDGDTSNRIINSTSQWTTEHSGVGCCLVFIRLHYNDEVWASGGLPNFTFIVKGRKDIYDPRTTSYGWTDNSALCTADYLNHPKYGFNAAYGTEIPITQLIAAANSCDESVLLNQGGTEKRYTCNGNFLLSSPRGDILDDLLSSCGGRITTYGGQYIIWPAVWQGTSGSSVDVQANAIGPVRWIPTARGRDLFNSCKGTYISPANNWQASDFPEYAQDTKHDPGGHLGYGTGGSGYSDSLLAADGGQRRRLNIALKFTTSPSMAQRLAKIELLRRRYPGTGVIPMNMTGYRMTPMDVWPFDFDPLGWTAKQLEVSIARFKLEPQDIGGGRQGIALSTEIEVQETDASIYDWSADEELTPQGYQQAALPSTRNLVAPTGLTLESDANTALLQNNGQIRSRVLVTWVDPADGYFNQGGHIELQYQLVTSPASPWSNTESILPGIQQIYIDQVEPGQQYNVQIRAVNTAGVPSDWVSSGPVDVSAHDTETYGPNGGGEYPAYTDPVYAQAMFSLTLEGTPQDDGSVSVAAVAGVVPPANTLSSLIPAPVISPTYTVHPTGGTIPGGTAVYLSLVAVDTNGDYTEDSDVLLINIPAGTNTNSVDLTITNYSAGMTLFHIRTGLLPAALRYRRSNSASASITLTSLTTTTGDAYAGPDPNFDHLEAGWTKVLLAGSFGGAAGATSKISAVSTSSGNHYTLTLSGAAFSAGSLVGRILSTIATAASGNPTPLQDYTITGNTATTVTVVAPPPPFSWNGPGPSFAVDDQVVVRLSPTTFTGFTLGDSLLSMGTDDYKGKVLRARYADGTNQTAFIAGNDATTFTLETDLNRGTPVMYWVEESNFSAFQPTPPPDRSNHSTPIDVAVPIDNIEGFLAVIVFAVTIDGARSFPDWSPIRDAYWPGMAGSGGAAAEDPGYQTLTVDGSNNVNIDLAPGGVQKLNCRLLLDSTMESGSPLASLITILPPTRTGGTITSGLSFFLYIGQDSTGNHLAPNLDTTSTAGFTTGANVRLSQGLDGTPGNWTYVQFTFHGTKWDIDTIVPGLTLS